MYYMFAYVLDALSGIKLRAFTVEKPSGFLSVLEVLTLTVHHSLLQHREWTDVAVIFHQPQCTDPI